MRIFVWAALAAAALAPAALRAECKFEQERTGGESAAGVSRLVLVAAAGELEVRGDAKATRVEATGKACASSQALLDQITLKTRREGSTLFVEVIMPKLNDVTLFGSNSASLDLRVTLPTTLPVEAQDSSGDAVLEDLKSIKLLDSSGDLTIRNIAGAVDVRDSSGDIEVEGITGNVEVLVDSSGDIEIEEVSGNVHIAQDSSGGIELANVKGNVAIDADTSGGIAVRNIGGDFTVAADTNGGIRHDNVTGRVSLPGVR